MKISIKKAAALADGRSHMCGKCPFSNCRGRQQVCDRCSDSFIEGFLKGYKYAKRA